MESTKEDKSGDYDNEKFVKLSIKLEKEQQAELNSLTLHMILYATIGTLCAALIALGLRVMDIATISPELQFLPWSLALVYGTTIGYKRGVLSARK